MSPELKKALEEYLLKLLSAAEKGAEWTMDQIPLVVQEKLTYDFVVASIFVVFGIGLIVAGKIFHNKMYRMALNNQMALRPTLSKDDPFIKKQAFEDGNHFAGAAVRVVASVAGFVMVLVQTQTLAKIYFAPRLYIIDWLKSAIQ